MRVYYVVLQVVECFMVWVCKLFSLCGTSLCIFFLNNKGSQSRAGFGCVLAVTACQTKGAFLLVGWH